MRKRNRESTHFLPTLSNPRLYDKFCGRTANQTNNKKCTWLSRSVGLLAHIFAASTILAVASASSLAAERRRLCVGGIEWRVSKWKKEDRQKRKS